MNKAKPLSKQGFEFQLFFSTNDLPKAWEQAAPKNNIFLQRDYFRSLEQAPPKGLKFCYLLFHYLNTPIGVAFCQISPFNVGDSVQSEDGAEKYPCLVRAFGRIVRTLVSGKNHNLLVCGNLLLTGEHAYFFQESVERIAALELVEEALIFTQKELASQGLHIDGIMIKDVEAIHRVPLQMLADRKFSEFAFHPNMVLQVREHWLSFDDYMDDISSKYKVRARKAFKSLDGIEKKELSAEELTALQGRLFELYKKVVDGQDFNMVSLTEPYMQQLKVQLGDLYKVYCYYLNGEMIGFFTTISNYDELEAHFLGFDPAFNREYQLYHNMLFDILKLGIEQRVKRIIYARTAMEIKSTLGAEAHEMYCYIRATNRLTNKILPSIVDYLKPSSDWVARNPFKD